MEWTSASQKMHAWEDMSGIHHEGPFKGTFIDENKCLLSCLVDPDDLLQAPENLSDAEADKWYEEATDMLATGDLDALVELAGQDFVNKLMDASPESWGGNIFYVFGAKAEANLKKVLPLFEACGCRHGQISNGQIWIEWDKV